MNDHTPSGVSAAPAAPDAVSALEDGARDRDSGLHLWQDQLAAHFAKLASERAETGWPVFALEHGLNQNERDALMHSVRARAALGPDRSVPLPWVVYATEIGYVYSGFEYWQTFDAQTPGWDHQWRDAVRSRFVSFAASYHGAQPAGAWANQFSIIAWPITHGVLPRDLQRQLAELLYDASMTFRPETFSSAEALGRHLRARCHGYSSRLIQFAENEVLLGQIALALLLQDAADLQASLTGTILQPETLDRIVSDLSRERDAREWLADARSRAQSRVRGLGRIPFRRRVNEPADRAPLAEGRRDEPDRPLGPRVALFEEGRDRWGVALRVPNLAQLAARSQRTERILAHVQGRVAGATNPVLAMRRVLVEAEPTVRLAMWPPPQTQLLTFDGAPPELEAVLKSAFRMPARDLWVFTVRSDGWANELHTKVLRAGASYLLLRKEEFLHPAASLGFRGVGVECRGIFGVRLDVPSPIPDGYGEVLGRLGLDVAPSLDVWPVGLPVEQWSGEGDAGWIADQSAILAVRADHRLRRIVSWLDGVPQPPIELAPESVAGGPLFIELPALEAGFHHISLAAETTDDINSRLAGEPSKRDDHQGELRGELRVIVRVPRTGAAGQLGALSFAVYPRSPSLEDIWEDRIDLHVAAPGAAALRCSVTLWGSERRELVTRVVAIPSPCDTDCWRRNLHDLRPSLEQDYDEANACTISFEGGALGRALLTAERDYRSLRWAVRRNGRTAVLVDMQGDSDLTISMYRCSAPSRAIPVDSASAERAVAVDDEGCLLVAKRGARASAVVVVPPQHLRGLSSLGLKPVVPADGVSLAQDRTLFELAEVWETARLGGAALASARQEECVHALISAGCGALGGKAWSAIEERVRSGGDLNAITWDAGPSVAPAKTDQESKAKFAHRLAGLRLFPGAKVEDAFVEAIRWLSRTNDAQMAAHLAFRLADSVVAAREWADNHPLEGGAGEDNFARYLHVLESSQFIVRAARFVLLCRQAFGSE